MFSAYCDNRHVGSSSSGLEFSNIGPLPGLMYLVSVYYGYISGVAGISAYLVLEKLEIMILVKQQLRRMVKEAPTLL